MQTVVVKWGNDQGIRIPKAFLENMQIAENDLVDMVVESEKIIIKKADCVYEKKHKTTRERLQEFYGNDFEQNHSPQKEFDWGEVCRKRNRVKQGDIIWLDFDPQTGYEQKGRRPAIVVSNESFNNFSKMAIVCPITNKNKDHPFHIKLDERTNTTGVILCDQVRTLDITARNYEFIESLPADILCCVSDIIYGFIEIGNYEKDQT